MKYCSQCGEPLEEGTAFCTECGAKQPVRKVAVQQPAAQQPVRQPAVKQPAAGQSAVQNAPAAKQPAAPAKKKKKKKRGGAVGLIIAIIVVVLLLIVTAVLILVRFLQNRNAAEDLSDSESISEEAEEEEDEPAVSEAKQALYAAVSVSGLDVTENEYGEILASCTLTAPDLEAAFAAAVEGIDPDADGADDALYTALAAAGTATVEYTLDLRPLLTEDRDYTEEEVTELVAEQYVNDTLELLAWKTVYSGETVPDFVAAMAAGEEAE